MRPVRTILALLIALALAALPVGATATAAPMLGAGPAAGLHVHADAASAEAAAEAVDADFCNHHGMATAPALPPASKPHAKCPLGFCCVGAAAAFNAVAVVAFKFQSDRQGRMFAPADHFIPDHAGSPPFRPPRA